MLRGKRVAGLPNLLMVIVVDLDQRNLSRFGSPFTEDRLMLKFRGSCSTI